MFGISKNEMIGKSVKTIFGEDFPLNPASVPTPLLRDGSWTGEWKYGANGKSSIIHICALTFKNGSDKLLGFIGCAQDITEYHTLESQLRQAQKMESIGTLAAGIAHDFKNFLSGIQGCSSLLLSEMKQDDKHYEDIKSIGITAQHAVDLANRLLTVTRTSGSEKLVCLVNQIIERTVGVLKGSISKNINIELHLDENLPSIVCKPGQTEQVMMNLGINAADAMPNGGELVIRTGLTTLDESYCLSYPDLVPGEYVFISVRDSGTGITTDAQQKVFEPLYTTKEAGKGTGLGLSVVYGIVREHGGAISLDSRQHVGSRFTVYLPTEIKECELIS